MDHFSTIKTHPITPIPIPGGSLFGDHLDHFSLDKHSVKAMVEIIVGIGFHILVFIAKYFSLDWRQHKKMLYKQRMKAGDVIRYFNNLPEMRQLVEDCYYDESVLQAARRFYKSEEFQTVLELFASYNPNNSNGLILDIGGGNGVASLAWEWAGHKVILVEPDDDELVGWGAIAPYIKRSLSSIKICVAFGENLPFESNTFDGVYVRQVLHHAADLNRFVKEVYRILKPGGIFIATREHVISNQSDLDLFLENHPMHAFTGGENAYLLRDYLHAFRKAGFYFIKTLGPWQSVINYYPMSRSQFTERCAQALSKHIGKNFGKHLARVHMIQKFLGWYWTRKDQSPGRLYSFIAIR